MICFLFGWCFVQASGTSDISVRNNKILYKDEELHPGCLRTISSQLNGDEIALIVNIDFQTAKGQFIGRGCMSANQYFQTPFIRNDYLTYVEDEKNIKNILKDPLLRFDGFGYKLAKKIDDAVFAIDVREFTTGSSDFLTTLIVEVVENPVFSISPDGKTTSATVIGLKKIGEVLKGTVNWQEKVNEGLKIRKNFKSKPKDKSVI